MSRAVKKCHQKINIPVQFGWVGLNSAQHGIEAGTELNNIWISIMTNLSVNADIEDNEKDKWYDPMGDEVEINEIHFDVEGMESEGGGAYFFTNIKCIILIHWANKIINKSIFIHTCIGHIMFTIHSELKKLGYVVNDGKDDSWKNVNRGGPRIGNLK